MIDLRPQWFEIKGNSTVTVISSPHRNGRKISNAPIGRIRHRESCISGRLRRVRMASHGNAPYRLQNPGLTREAVTSI